MPVRKMTPQEKAEWLGSGIVLSGIKPPKRLPQQSPDVDQGTETGPLESDEEKTNDV